jgi:TolB-like protein/Flp pilus assembly protein TadD
MGEEASKPASAPTGAVFLSYASQDAEAAQKIAEALRAGGIEVFLDQSELRGGDAWDQKIRHEIHDCALFVPIISQHTQQRLEGYFRREWKLAIDRTHDIAEQKPFLVPVVVDGTRDQEAFVPDAFRAVQWIRLPDGDTPPAFVERIERLLSPELSPLSAVSAAVRVSRQSKSVPLAVIAIVVFAALAYFVADKFWMSGHLDAFGPPPHSIAVLPFLNLSGDASQEYFSDGLTEELLNSLAEIDELQVAARTSAFSFKGTSTDIGTIARKLNVGAVLEGSVRRSGNTVRITAQLINALTGFHLWSHTYDRDLGDVLKLETEIAKAVASALKVSLLGDVATKIQLGGTRNPAAFDAYLRGRMAAMTAHGGAALQTEIAAYTEAIGLDPSYALAFANRSLAHSLYANNDASGTAMRESYDQAQSDAHNALALAPDLAEGHAALGVYFENGLLDFARADEEYKQALARAQGNARVLRVYGLFSVYVGRTEAGIAASRRAVILDPLNRGSHFNLGVALYFAHRYKEAIAIFKDALALDPQDPLSRAFSGLAYYSLGEFERARASCESKPDNYLNRVCLALTYEKLGRRDYAEAQLAALTAAEGEGAAYQYAQVYGKWGNPSSTLEWLQTALRLRDPGLVELKTDPLMDPVRKEPRFQAIERELKFP